MAEFTLSWVLGYTPPSFTLASPSTPTALSPGPLLPGLFVASECPIVGFTPAQLLAIIERSYPRDYLEGLRATPNGGYELFHVASRVLARVSEAVAEFYCCSLIAFAHGPALSTGVVEFYRDNDDEGAVTLGAGTLVRASRTGRTFRILTPAVFGPTDLGPVPVDVEAAEPSQQWDIAGTFITAGGETIEGEIDELAALDASSVGFDPSMRVRQPAATTGGQSPCLDGLGEQVGISRLLGESDARYKLRIIQTPDTISPDAIERGLDSILGALGLHACLREVGTPRLPGFFFDAGSSSDSPQVPANNYAFDMDFTVRPEDRFKLLLDEASFRGFMLIGVPPIPDIAEFGLFFDTATSDAFPLQNAFDTISMTQPNVAFDGFSTLNSSIYQAIYAMIEEKRAAGVGFELYLENLGCT